MLLDKIVLPVADPDDAKASARALEAHLDGDSSVVVVHVIEKGGGAPDKAPMSAREEEADTIFALVRRYLPDAETDLRYATDVVDAIFEAADEHEATAIAFTPRGGSRWVRLLTGDVALSLITDTDRPVIVLPDIEAEDPA